MQQVEQRAALAEVGGVATAQMISSRRQPPAVGESGDRGRLIAADRFLEFVIGDTRNAQRGFALALGEPSRIRRVDARQNFRGGAVPNVLVGAMRRLYLLQQLPAAVDGACFNTDGHPVEFWRRREVLPSIATRSALSGQLSRTQAAKAAAKSAGTERT